MIAIDESLCVGCGRCVEACPVQAIYLVDKKARVVEARCRSCGACVESCSRGAITLKPPSSFSFSQRRPLARWGNPFLGGRGAGQHGRRFRSGRRGW